MKNINLLSIALTTLFASTTAIASGFSDHEDVTRLRDLSYALSHAQATQNTILLTQVDDAIVVFLDKEMEEKRVELNAAERQVMESKRKMHRVVSRKSSTVKSFALLDDKLDLNFKIDEALKIQSIRDWYESQMGETDAESIVAKRDALNAVLKIQNEEMRRNRLEAAEPQTYKTK